MSLETQGDKSIKQENGGGDAVTSSKSVDSHEIKGEAKDLPATNSPDLTTTAAAAATKDQESDSSEFQEEIIKTAREYGRGYKSDLTLNQLQNQLIKLARRTQHGTTSLPFVYNTAALPSQSLVADKSIGKIQDGVPHLLPYQEKAVHRLKPIYSVEHSSPFSSHLPSLMTTHATASMEQSRILLNRLNGTNEENEVVDQDLQNLLESNLVYDTTLATINYADSLLEVLTRGEHPKTDLVELQLSATEESGSKRTFEESQSENLDDEQDQQTPKELKETTRLLTELEGSQRKRLALSSIPIRPTAEEIDLAGRVTANLTSTIIGSKVAPADLVSTAAIRKALGIEFLPPQENDSNSN